jgi:hypothetical protein
MPKPNRCEACGRDCRNRKVQESYRNRSKVICLACGGWYTFDASGNVVERVEARYRETTRWRWDSAARQVVSY